VNLNPDPHTDPAPEPQSNPQSHSQSSSESSLGPSLGAATAPTSSKALSPRLAAGLVFITSGAVLVLEIVGLRLVAPYVGVTLQSNTAVIGVTLTAIALGAWLGGRLADLIDPRRMLAPAILLGAGTTALTLPLVRYAGEALRGTDPAAVLLVALLTLFAPALLLSSVTPMVVKLQLGDLRRTGTVVGKLSGIGTLGSITATFGTGFVLVAALPSSVIVLSLAALLLIVGIALAVHLRVLTRRAGAEGSHSDRQTTAVAMVLALFGTGFTLAAPNPCDVETAYHCASVEPDPDHRTGRLLVLNSGWHSYVDLADPQYLEFDYTQMIASVADVMRPAGEPLRTLHIGGGGFTLPRYLAATRPGSHTRVLEVDQGVVDLDRAELGLVTGPDLQVWVGDGRVGLAQEADAQRDLVIGDAFGHLTVPWHLTTREAIEEIHRILTPQGIYAMNVIDGPPNRFLRAELATVAEVFRYMALISTPEGVAEEETENFVLVASDAPLPVEAVRDRLAERDTEAVVLAGDQLREFIGDADPLTDDYAPVDQMLGR